MRESDSIEYRKLYTLMAIALIGLTGYDLWLLISKNINLSRHLPGLPELVIILCIVGLRKMQIHEKNHNR